MHETALHRNYADRSGTPKKPCDVADAFALLPKWRRVQFAVARGVLTGIGAVVDE